MGIASEPILPPGIYNTTFTSAVFLQIGRKGMVPSGGSALNLRPARHTCRVKATITAMGETTQMQFRAVAFDAFNIPGSAGPE